MDSLQNQIIKKPIGSSLVCSYCHLFHLNSDCGHWGEPCQCCERENLVLPPFVGIGAESSEKKAPLRVVKGKKKQDTYHFGEVLEEGTKQPKCKVTFKNEKKWAYCHKHRHYVHISECHWDTDARFDRAYELEDTGTLKPNGKKLYRRKTGKRTENVTETKRITLDFDTDNPDIPELILQRCHDENVSNPYEIGRNPVSGRYQAKWEDNRPLPAKCLSWWQSMADGLFKMFTLCEGDRELFKCDSKILNPSTYSRNFNKADYEIEHKGSKVKFRELSKQLTQAGYIPKSSRKAPKNKAQHKLIFFLNSHNGIITTHKELYSECNITEPTGYRAIEALKRIGRVETERVRVGSTYKTKFTLLKKPDTKPLETVKVSDSHTINKEVVRLLPLPDSVKDTDSKKKKSVKAEVLDALRRVSVFGLPYRWRNEGAFMLSLGSKACGFSELEVLERLEMGFSKCRYVGDHEFSREEFRQAVNSPFRNNYRYCMGRKSKRVNWEGFLKALENLERGNVIEMESLRKRKKAKAEMSKVR